MCLQGIHEQIRKLVKIKSCFWIPGHRGIKGNQIVDKLAKKALNNTSFGPEPFIGVSNGTIKAEKGRWLTEKFTDYWARAQKMKHSKRMISIPNSNDSNWPIKMSKNSLRIYTMFLMGHGHGIFIQGPPP